MHGVPIEALVSDFFVVLAFSVLVVLISQQLRLSAVVGLLLTGILIGPSGLGFVARDEVELFAEIGVILLLFTVGLEVSLVRLRQNWRNFLIGGSLQVSLTIGVCAGLAIGFGVPEGNAVFLGCLAALSSTAIVFKIYGDRRELLSPQGSMAAGILLFQDFCLAPMILLVPVLAGAAASTASVVALRLGLGVVLVGAVFVAARKLMPHVLSRIVETRVREVFVLGALAVCLGMALVTAKLGFSLALGAFLAGLLMSESEYSHQMIVEVLPIRDVFNSLFFISVGMLLDLQEVGGIMPQVAFLGLTLLLGKAVILFVVATLMSYPARIGVIVALSLAQVGEFSFVLGGLGAQYELLDSRFYQAFLGSSIITMLLTPLLIQLAPSMASRVPEIPFLGRLQRLRLGDAQKEADSTGLRRHVVVVGYGLNGRNLCRVLKQTAIPFVVVELNGQLVHEARSHGMKALYGDAARPEILGACDVHVASMLVVSISDLAVTRQVVRLGRAANPNLRILVRTREVSEVDELLRRGASEVIPEEFETSVEIFSRVLAHYHVPSNILQAHARMVRGEGYEMLRRGPSVAEPALSRIGALLEATLTDTFLVENDSAANGCSLRDLDLRRRSGGASVIAIVRGGAAVTNPSADMKLQTHDNLVLVGSHAALADAMVLLEGGQQPPEGDPTRPS